MIKVVSFKHDSLSIGFKIEGHALSRKEMENTIGDAYDMICNSVSVLSQGTLIGMVEVLKLPVKYELTFEKSIESVIMSLDASLGKNKRNKYIKFMYEEV